MPHFDKLISPPIATALMKQDLFLPSLAASVVLLICIAILADKGLLSPQGEPLLGTNNTRSHVASATATRPGFFPSHSEDEGLPDTNPVCQGAFFAQPARRLRGVTSFLYREPILGLCFFAFFLKSNAMASEGFVFQYLSEKFGWPLRDTTILRFALSFGAVISTLIIGPLVSSTLTRRATQPATINLIMIHSSLLLLVVCFIVAWQARSSAIFILCKHFGPPISIAYAGPFLTCVSPSDARSWFWRRARTGFAGSDVCFRGRWWIYKTLWACVHVQFTR